MGENSGIQWTHHTFNPWIGCAKVSPACDNCYAERGSARLGAQHKLKLWGGDRYQPQDGYWKQPAVWNRKAEKARERHRVFCASYSDVFEDRLDLLAPRTRLFKIIEQTPHLDWLLLTKRPENMLMHTRDVWPVAWPENVWAGTTAEDQEHFELRWAHLRKVPASVRFVSAEPMLGPISLLDIPRRGIARPHWVIAGGESGASARPAAVEWFRKLGADCAELGIAFFMKQMGRRIFGPSEDFGMANHYLRGTRDAWYEWHPPIIGVNAEKRPSDACGFTLFDLHGGDPSEWPEDLRVREFPRE